MSTSYKFLPLVYDQWQQSYGKDYSSLIFPRLLATLKRHRIPTSSMLDLACGTGTLAVMMARHGWSVWGIDGSEGMLAEARKRVAGKKLSVNLSHQDMRRFSLPLKVSLVSSMFDSLNHLRSARDLLQTFRRVHAALLAEGFFVFDVNNELCYKTLWMQTEVIQNPAFTVILQNSYNSVRRSAFSHVTMFLRSGDSYTRLTETVRERYYPRDEIADLLDRAGFRIVESEDFNFTNNPKVGKIKTWWVVQKANG